MKKFICAMLSLLLLMPPACMGFSVSAEAQADPELHFRSVSGKWETENDRVVGGGEGNVFCVSDTFLEKGQSWCFSAKVRIFSGNEKHGTRRDSLDISKRIKIHEFHVA